jgi:hypothetical protein
VIEADSRAVLNTLTEHDFQDAFKNDRSPGNCAAERGYFEGVVACRPKLCFFFYQRAIPISEIMDGSL